MRKASRPYPLGFSSIIFGRNIADEMLENEICSELTIACHGVHFKTTVFLFVEFLID